VRRWRGWAERTEVERVDLYTRQSVYVLMWAFAALLLTGLVPDLSAPELAAAVVGTLVLGAAATRLLGDVVRLYPASSPVPWRSVGLMVALSVVAESLTFVAPEGTRTNLALVVWSMLAWSLGGLRDRRATAALLVATVLVPWLPAREGFAAGYGLAAGLIIVFTVRLSLWLLGVVTELDAARSAQSSLAVAEERLRFSRDVHDVLGRRLSTIAVQSDLAATLAGRGDVRAAEQMLEVRSIAHEALREARALARGYRETDLGQELRGARSLLESASIACEVDVVGLPQRWHEAAGWVVREAVTNVLRHSEATHVHIGYDGRALVVRNDGASSSTATGGVGLVGLRERLQPLGATLDTDRDGCTYTLRMVLPETEETA
jgi:two-component system, NarL family, sensor histidine kinase DesK